MLKSVAGALFVQKSSVSAVSVWCVAWCCVVWWMDLGESAAVWCGEWYAVMWCEEATRKINVSHYGTANLKKFQAYGKVSSHSWYTEQATNRWPGPRQNRTSLANACTRQKQVLASHSVKCCCDIRKQRCGRRLATRLQDQAARVPRKLRDAFGNGAPLIVSCFRRELQRLRLEPRPCFTRQHSTHARGAE